MSNQENNGNKLFARIFAGVMAGILLLGTVFGVLIYIIWSKSREVRERKLQAKTKNSKKEKRRILVLEIWPWIRLFLFKFFTFYLLPMCESNARKFAKKAVAVSRKKQKTRRYSSFYPQCTFPFLQFLAVNCGGVRKLSHIGNIDN